MQNNNLAIAQPKDLEVLETLARVSDNVTDLCDSLTRLQLLAISPDIVNWCLRLHSHLLTSNNVLRYDLDKAGIQMTEDK